MTRGEMIVLLRAHLSDEQAVGWPTDVELLAYLDSAAGAVSNQRAAAKDPEMSKDLELGEGENGMPDDFISLIGNVPVMIAGRKLTAPSGMTVRYWARLPFPSSFKEKEQLPYSHENELLMIDIAAAMALNKNEYDVSQDLGIIGQMSSAAQAARAR